MQRAYFDLQHVADVSVVTFTERELVDEQMLHTIGERLAGLADTVGQRELLLNLGNVIHVNSLALAKFVGLNTVIRSGGGQLTQAAHLRGLPSNGARSGPEHPH